MLTVSEKMDSVSSVKYGGGEFLLLMWAVWVLVGVIGRGGGASVCSRMHCRCLSVGADGCPLALIGAGERW